MKTPKKVNEAIDKILHSPKQEMVVKGQKELRKTFKKMDRQKK